MKMKRLIAMLLALCAVVSLCACGNAADSAADTTAAPETTEATVVTTEAPEETTEAEITGIVYTVKVEDEGGNPVAGAMVQMCEGTNCVPASTNDEGVATFNVQAEAAYEVKFMTMPAGYDYTTEEQVFHFDSGAYEMTIVLKAVA